MIQMAEAKAKIADYKKKEVKEIEDLMKKYEVVGVVNMEALPAKQLQNMRDQLRKDGVMIRMSKISLIRIALEELKKSKEGIEQLETKLKGKPVALLLANTDPFKLYKTLKKNKSSAPAKAGQEAPKDIIVPAGPTGFAPGPIISELASVGIKTKVESGKLTIVQDTTVAKEGDKISMNLASMLTRLGIEPMEIGLDLMLVYDKGSIFDKKVLAVDEDEYLANITQAARWGFNLAMDIAYPTKTTTELLLQKAFKDSKALAISQDILCSATVDMLLAKAQNQANYLSSLTK